MTQTELEHRGGDAWPKGAAPISLLAGLAAVAAGIAVTAGSGHAPVAALCLLLGLAVGSSLVVVGIRRWLGGQAFPPGLGAVSGLTAVGGVVLSGFTGFAGAGGALLIGLAGGCLLGNVWAVRAARRHRRR